MDEKDGKRGISRRGFLRAAASTAGVAVAAGGLGTLAALSEEEANAVVVDEFYHNTCRGNCGGLCDLNVRVREGHVVSVRPHEVPNTNVAARDACVRGQSTPQRLYSPYRFLYPMRRTGERGSGEFERITWDEAMSTVSQKMREAIEESGAGSLAVYHSFGSTTWLNGAISHNGYHPRVGYGVGFERFIRKTGCTVFTPSADLSQMYMYSNDVLGVPYSGSTDCLNSDLIVIWGCNVTDACRVYWPSVCDSHKKGTKIYVIDPQFTTAANLADIFLPIRPGTDGALMLGMCNYAIENGLIDESYLANKSVAPLLIKDDGTYAKLSDFGLPPIESVHPLTGQSFEVDSEVVWDASQGVPVSSFQVQDPPIRGEFEYRGAKLRTVFDYVYGKTKHFTLDYAADVCDLPLDRISQLADDYATANAATIMTFQGLGHHYNSRHNFKCLPYLASLTGNIGKPGASINQNTMGYTRITGAPCTLSRDVLEVEDAKPNNVIAGQYLPEIMETGKWAGNNFPIKVLYGFNGNPLASESGRKDFIEAFKKIDFIVWADSFMTDTVLFADMALPVCMSYETEDFNGFGGANTFMLQKCVEPAGESRSDMDIFRALADGLGYDDLYYKTDEEYLRATLDSEENKAVGRGYDDFKESGSFYEIPDYTLIMPETNPTGRTQFYIPVAVPRSEHGRPLDETERIPWFEPTLIACADNPDMEKYPFFGLSQHDNYFGHSMFNQISWFDELRPEPYCRINEEAAKKKGIAQGDYVRVFNDKGHCVLKAVLTKGIRPDCILMPHGWQARDYREGHHQDLTYALPDPMTANSCYYEYICDVEKYEEVTK